MFLDNLNSLRPSIQFTLEIEDERKLPFLDVQVTRDAESGIFRTAVYRKPTHTDRYLHYESYHPAHVKTGVIRTLLQRSRRICNSEAAATKEMRHIQKVFGNNGYPTTLHTTMSHCIGINSLSCMLFSQLPEEYYQSIIKTLQ